MKKTILLSLTVMTAILAFTGCSKDDDSSLQPKGDYVATGTNNNTVQSFTFTIDSVKWVADAPNKQWGVSYTLPASANLNGAVLLYAQDGSNWSALPKVDYGNTYEFGYNSSTKIIEIQTADAKATTMIVHPGSMTFKAVAIPPAMRKANPNVDLKNYLEIKTVYHLPN